MNLLLGLAPFIIFFVLMRLDISLALWGAFAAAFALCIRDFLKTSVLRVLDAGSIALFGALALYTGFIQTLSIPAVRFAVDATLTVLIIGSMLFRQPFTMQYAREQVPRDFWPSPLFIRANYLLTAVWALAFAVCSFADGTATFAPRLLSLSFSIVIGLAAMAVAFLFTVKYAAEVRKEAGLPHLHWFR